MKSEHQRVFFALWPAPELAGCLHALGAPFSGRPMPEDSLHLTLAFLGEVSPAQIELLCEIAAGLSLPRCGLRIDQLGYWPHNRILWAGPGQLPEGLQRFVAELHEALRAAGFALEARAFRAHITLQRKAEDPGFDICEAPALILPVASWCLAASQAEGAGSRYRVLQSWPAA
ncbi:RNA 2',3'-cyclic phosphodiesterase [Uliginosibacterium flavum]|uniref:RNA 2',3'-cyclic phosphodiesterase n=1 Tax=Uliginosibacterium flavum TaxID=1396831 RepID=A0ABV2TNZ9_9RHOO